ncbi:glycosyl transferase, partial [Mrakia frigida]|uniref:glycosyl transferase n=1 Tax=Mrakia frigida TaxID=29902 RepID=UPI003FCC052A
FSYQTKTFLSYSTRFLWDRPDGPSRVIPHFYAEGMPTDKLCGLHGWKGRKENEQVQVWDAVLFSTELDLLEVRLAELEPFVDLFIIVESTHTFTGLPRNLTLPPPSSSSPLPLTLQPFASKLLIVPHPGRPLAHASEDPFVLEREQRSTVTSIINAEILRRGAEGKSEEVVVVMGDVDEIPRRETVGILRECELGKGWGKIHLQLRQYLYSFEFPTDFASWRLQAHHWIPGKSYYMHSQSTDRVLADSGWHCSFCFKTLPQFTAKMVGFSHADRLGSSASRLLAPKRLQKVICEGSDIFGMLPEAYRFKDLVNLWKLDRSASAVGLPRRVLEGGKERFGYLLPGGCVRDG